MLLPSRALSAQKRGQVYLRGTNSHSLAFPKKGNWNVKHFFDGSKPRKAILLLRFVAGSNENADCSSQRACVWFLLVAICA